MNSDINSTITVIANAIENDTQKLKLLLQRNGIQTNKNTSKDELQVIVNTALVNSETFRKEFTNWVLERSNQFSNFTGFANSVLPTTIGYIPGQSDATQLTSTATSQTFGGLDFNSTTAPNQSTSATPPKTSPWSLSLNQVLEFAQTGMNNYVALQQSKTEQDTVNAALEAKRLELQMNPSGTTAKKSSVVTIAVVSALALVTVGGIIFYIKKNKK